MLDKREWRLHRATALAGDKACLAPALCRRAAERLLVGPAPAPCVLRLAGWLPLRVLRHLYTFVVLLVGECFASPQDLSEEIEVGGGL